MPLTCPFLLLFVLKLENHLSQELEIVYRAWAQKISEYLLFFVFSFSVGTNPPPPPPHPTPKKKKYFLQILDSLFFVKIHLQESSKLEL